MNDEKKFIIVIIIPVIIGLGFYSSLDSKKRSFEKGATLACSHAQDVKFISKRKGAYLLNDITSIIQDKTKYNLFSCDLVDDDKLKKIQQEFLNELLNK